MFKNRHFDKFFKKEELPLSSEFLDLFTRMYHEDENMRPALLEIKNHKWVNEGPLPTEEEILEEIKFLNLIKEEKMK